MAIGSGFPEMGSTNRSGIHWDMICDPHQGGQVWVDDQLFAKDGKFTIWRAKVPPEALKDCNQGPLADGGGPWP